MDEAVVLGKKGYSLSNTLGEGTYSKVKSAYSDRLKCNVAIKVINKSKTSQKFRERFLPREVEALRCLHHPSIIKTYEIFETSSAKVYIVMELAEKGDLLHYLKLMGAMKEDMACTRFQQLASAIEHCHNSDFAHRDLKCENILLDADLNVKLSDFGFSKSLSWDKNGTLILSETFCGTAAYAAPEVLQCIPYDPRISDIWSLGVILYIMLHAAMPFNHPNVKKLVRIQKRHKVPFPDSKHLTGECKDLICRLLQPNASQRLRIDEVLKHSWLQTPKATVPSLLPAAEEGECSQNLCEGKLEHNQQGKSYSVEREGEQKEMDPLTYGWF
ncbi:PREDICTED: testis-specific serine/threonine-protein kinase 2-like [Chaetura pelagica]|uniref:testis-specific serine/threonine-protein kinase 2-like n=1 Tax=Chaetura pelagica TaxID=8897 RepID=UPI0005236DA6|nr:PREDICTED: testis-specific serine/threonine-protein kinase 2-like [Chaetura pelagica]